MAKHFVSVLIIITKELWDRCQEQKALNNFNNRPGHVANDLFVLQGLIRCGTTNSICTCERKKKKYNYIFCYREDRTRGYIPEHIILDKITEILERIRLPEHVMTEMKEDLKKIKSKEKAYCKQETAKLKQDMEELKKKMDHLFDLRLEGEIEREMFDAKRMDLELKIGRVQDKIIAHEKADNRFNETILDLLDISKEAKNIFLSARKVEQKRFLLRFIFKIMILTEDTLAYELNFPFKEFEYSNIARMEREKLELAGSKKTQGFQGNENKNAEEKIEKELELHFSHKNQGFRLKNLNPVQCGWSEFAVFEMKIVFNKYKDFVCIISTLKSFKR